MKINTIIIMLFLVSIVVLSGCAQQQTKYVCSDGTTVSDSSLCPKEKTEVVENEKEIQAQCYVKGLPPNSFHTECYDYRGDEPYRSSASCVGEVITLDNYICVNNLCEKRTDRSDCS